MRQWMLRTMLVMTLLPSLAVAQPTADGDFVAVHAHGKRYLVYVNMSDLAAQMDPERFVRIHRSHLVNLDVVTSMVAYDASRLEVRLQDGTRLVASRAGTQLLRARFSPS